MQRTDISAFVAEAAADVPERQALVESGGRTLTWAALEDEVARIATGLGAQGIRAGRPGAALVEGDAKSSLMFQRIESGEMPPGDIKVTPEELARIGAWLAGGAPTAGTRRRRP